MEFTQRNEFSESFFNDSSNIKSLLENYIVHLKWFILSVLIFGALAFFKVRYEVPQYFSSAQVLIKKTQKGNSVGDLSSFEDLGVFGKDRSNIENEIQILSSRRLISEVIKELDLNIQFFIEKKPYNIEQFPDTPFSVNYKSEQDTLLASNEYFDNDPIYTMSTSFSILILSKDRFEYFDSDGISKGIKNFGKRFITADGNIIMRLNQNKTSYYLKKKIHVVITPLEEVIDIYKNSLVVEALDEKSDILNISLKGPVLEKSVLTINNLIEQYNADAVEDKAKIYKKTTAFLNGRIDLLINQLSAIEASAEQFKTQKGLVDVQSESGVFLESSSINERELVNANT